MKDMITKGLFPQSRCAYTRLAFSQSSFHSIRCLIFIDLSLKDGRPLVNCVDIVDPKMVEIGT